MSRAWLAAYVVLSAVVFAEEPEVVITRQISLSERAQVWGLSESEFRHYENLMAGIDSPPDRYAGSRTADQSAPATFGAT